MDVWHTLLVIYFASEHILCNDLSWPSHSSIPWLAGVSRGCPEFRDNGCDRINIGTVMMHPCALGS